MDKKIVDFKHQDFDEKITININELKFIKNFRSLTAEEWYIFLPDFQDPRTQGAAGKAIIHYNLIGNRDIFIQTTIIFDDPALHVPTMNQLVYAISDEVINRLVGYADTLLSVHCGENSYDAEYVNRT